MAEKQKLFNDLPVERQVHTLQDTIRTQQDTIRAQQDTIRSQQDTIRSLTDTIRALTDTTKDQKGQKDTLNVQVCQFKRKRRKIATLKAEPPQFNDLPVEMQVHIFQFLNVHDCVTEYTKTCSLWREVIALHILAPELIQIANINLVFKSHLEKHNWTEDCEDVEMLIYIYNKTINPITSEFIFWALWSSVQSF